MAPNEIAFSSNYCVEVILRLPAISPRFWDREKSGSSRAGSIGRRWLAFARFHLVLRALRDSSPGVLIQAIRLTEQPKMQTAPVREALSSLLKNNEATIRLQLALSLGQWEPQWAGRQLAHLIPAGTNDSWFNTAVLSSVSKCAGDLLDEIVKENLDFPHKSELVKHLVTTAIKNHASDPINLLNAIIPEASLKAPVETWRLEAIASFLDAFGDITKISASDSRKLASLFSIAETQANDLSLSSFQRGDRCDSWAETLIGTLRLVRCSPF